MCETMRRIAVNSVIKCSFFYYICCFSIFPSSFIDSESGVTICNQYTVRRPDTWRHSTRHRPSPTYWRSFGTKPLSPALFDSRYWPLSVLGSRSWPFRVTWRHRSRDHSIPRWPFLIGAPLSPSLCLHPFPRYWPLSVLGSRPWPLRVTWRHRSRDYWTRGGPFPIGGPLEPSLYL